MQDEFNQARAELKQIIEDLGISFFLDIDGVIADMQGHLDNTPELHKDGKVLWNEMGHEFTSTIPVIDGARDFFFSLKDMGDVRFLTSPSLIDGNYSGKAKWVSESFLPEYGRDALRILMIVRKNDKHLLATPNRVLIDDTLSNVQDWQKAGGIGIHHTGDFEQTLQKVKDSVLLSNNPQPDLQI